MASFLCEGLTLSLSVAAAGTYTHADRIYSSALMSLLCCLLQIGITQLSGTFLGTAIILLSPHHYKRLLLMTTE